jgi:hypothetical protein
VCRPVHAPALVDPPRKLFPPEPLRSLGGSPIRRALVAKDAAEDEGRAPGRLTAFVASLPKRLGLHLPRSPGQETGPASPSSSCAVSRAIGTAS